MYFGELTRSTKFLKASLAVFRKTETTSRCAAAFGAMASWMLKEIAISTATSYALRNCGYPLAMSFVCTCFFWNGGVNASG